MAFEPAARFVSLIPVSNAKLRDSFEKYLRQRDLKFTAQRQRIFDRAFKTHDHFSAETLYGWLSDEEGARVSRATVYRTLALLVEGNFLESLDVGAGELVYEHVAGHKHHDHMVCVSCGRIEEFRDSDIERLQVENARKKGFVMVDHDLRLFGYCAGCVRQGLCPLVPGGKGKPPEVPEEDLGKPIRIDQRVPGRKR